MPVFCMQYLSSSVLSVVCAFAREGSGAEATMESVVQGSACYIIVCGNEMARKEMMQQEGRTHSERDRIACDAREKSREFFRRREEQEEGMIVRTMD